jgi:hypothetical protein
MDATAGYSNTFENMFNGICTQEGTPEVLTAPENLADLFLEPNDSSKTLTDIYKNGNNNAFSGVGWATKYNWYTSIPSNWGGPVQP